MPIAPITSISIIAPYIGIMKDLSAISIEQAKQMPTHTKMMEIILILFTSVCILSPFLVCLNITKVGLSNPLKFHDFKANIPTRSNPAFIFVDIGKLFPLLNGTISDSLVRLHKIGNPLINGNLLDGRHNRSSLESLILPTL